MTVHIRQVNRDEMDEILRLEADTWPEGTRASRMVFETRISIFPEGFIGAYVDGKLAGLATSMICDKHDPEDIGSWEVLTSCGKILNHKATGNTLYVVSVGVSPEYAGQGLGKFLMTAQKDLGTRLGLKQLVLGSRVPGFCKERTDMLLETYLSLENEAGHIKDPLVRFYRKCGLEIISLKRDYMEDDKESRNYGVIMKCDL